MIDSDTFYDLENHIRWGCTDVSRQATFIELLQASPDLAKVSDEFGTTLLMVAAEAANLEAARQLCLLGADGNAIASTGDTALVCAVRGILDGDRSAEAIAARAAIIDILLQHGADPNQRGWQGCGPLHYAVMYGLTDLVRHLLLGGADPLARLSDPPDDQNAIELAESGRYYGDEEQRKMILALLRGPKGKGSIFREN